MASNITVDTLTKGAVTLNTDEIVDTNSTQVCKAWVNFNGSGTVAIRGSYNVSSITDNGTGEYTANLTEVMSDVNYSVIVAHSGLGAAGADPSGNRMIGVSIISTSAVRMECRSITNVLEDYPQIFVSIFR